MADIKTSVLTIGSNNLILQDAAVRASIAPEYSSSSTYAVGDLCMNNGVLYECNTAISTAEAWTAAHWTAVTVGGEIATVKDGLSDMDDRVTALEEGGTGSGLTDGIKQALLQIVSKVAYIDEDGQDYYDALENALYPPAELVSISAVYTQIGTVYSTDSLDSLKADLVVTAHMSDSTTQTVTTYTLSGTLTEGTSTITVSYGGKTTTFSVNVTLFPSGYTRLDYISNETNTSAYIRTEFPSTTGNVFGYEFSVSCKAVGTIGSSSCVVFGGRNTNSGATAKQGILVYLNPTNFVPHYGNSSSDSIIIHDEYDVTADAYAKNTLVLKEGKAYLNGAYAADSGATEYVNVSSSYKFALFRRNQAGQYDLPFKGRIYGFYIKDGNGDYVLNYIPCQRDSDGIYGMYDLVSQTFISAYTSAFTGGNE